MSTVKIPSGITSLQKSEVQTEKHPTVKIPLVDRGSSVYLTATDLLSFCK